jgi:putative endonuclease
MCVRHLRPGPARLAAPDAQRAGFTSRYGCTLLVYFELLSDMSAAIAREKQLKAGSRAKKLALIEKANPRWCDLFEHLL